MENLTELLKGHNFPWNTEQIREFVINQNKNPDQLSDDDCKGLITLALTQRNQQAISKAANQNLADAPKGRKGKLKNYQVDSSNHNPQAAISHASQQVSESVEAFRQPIIDGINQYSEAVSDGIVEAIANTPAKIQQLVTEKALAVGGDPEAFRRSGESFAQSLFPGFSPINP